MDFSVTTRYTSNGAGRGGIVVRTAAGQRTYPFDHAARDAHKEAIARYATDMLAGTLTAAEDIGADRSGKGRLWQATVQVGGTQRYSDALSDERMRAGLCPECGYLPHTHDNDPRFWIPKPHACSLLERGVRDRIAAHLGGEQG